MAVGEVVLNRMASPEFPDTMREVLEQPGQYYGRNNPYFNHLKPLPASVEAARRLWRKYEDLPEREAKAKLSQALARRGFGWDAIESALDELMD